jgi:hypothetical protein
MFGEAMYALNLQAICLRGRLALSSPALLVCSRPREAPMLKWSKLELVKYLRLLGWVPLEDNTPALRQNAPLKFHVAGNLGTHAYLRCMVQSRLVFSKPGNLQKILHGASNMYYQALLNLDDLSELAAMEDGVLLRLQRAQLQDAGLALVAADLAEADALADGRRDVAEEGDGLDAVEPRPLQMAEPVVPVPDGGPPVPCRVPGFQHLKVYFDRFSHWSGNQRAFCHCPSHSGQCRLYVFVQKYESREHCASYLLAWATMASEFRAGQRDEHVAARPTADHVDVVHRAQTQ